MFLFSEAQVAMIPQTTVELTDEKALKDIQRILDLLDDDDDVTDVWHNWDEVICGMSCTVARTIL